MGNSIISSKKIILLEEPAREVLVIKNQSEFEELISLKPFLYSYECKGKEDYDIDEWEREILSNVGVVNVSAMAYSLEKVKPINEVKERYRQEIDKRCSYKIFYAPEGNVSYKSNKERDTIAEDILSRFIDDYTHVAGDYIDKDPSQWDCVALD